MPFRTINENLLKQITRPSIPAQPFKRVGSSYGSCNFTSCVAGYHVDAGSCVANICQPNQALACSTNHLVGTKTCNAQGSEIGACVTGSTCEAGYYYNNGVCTPQICQPNQPSQCSSAIGSGTHTCNTLGSDYGSCNLTACNSGYYFQNGSCLAQICQPSTITSCSFPNGTGQKLCNSFGSGYDSCAVDTCYSGYYKNNGSCVAQLCAPNSTRTCASAAHFAGLETCNSEGSAYSGTCVVTSNTVCAPGYYYNGSACLVSAQSVILFEQNIYSPQYTTTRYYSKDNAATFYPVNFQTLGQSSNYYMTDYFMTGTHIAYQESNYTLNLSSFKISSDNGATFSILNTPVPNPNATQPLLRGIGPGLVVFTNTVGSVMSYYSSTNNGLNYTEFSSKLSLTTSDVNYIYM